MKRLVLIILLLMVVLMTVVVPQSVNAASNEDASLFTPQEQQFLSGLHDRINYAGELLNRYRDFNLFSYGRYAASRLVGGRVEERWRNYKQGLSFPDCSMNSAPSTFKDIETKWNTNICPKFAKMSLIVEREFYIGITLEGWLALGESTKDEWGYIEGSLRDILRWVNERAQDLVNQRTYLRATVKGIKKDLQDEAKKTTGEAKEPKDDPKKPADDFCFIATAAYGTPTAKEIDKLRRFRDEYLRKSSLGNEFIKFYYENSPPIAEFISENEILRVIVREGFVEPAVRVVELTEDYWSE